MSDNEQSAREILDLEAQQKQEQDVRGGKKGSFDITELQGDPSQWGVAALNFTKIEL